MNGFKWWHMLVLGMLFFTTGCDKKPVGAVAPMHWDRDMCERCKMALSDRKFAVQIINPDNGNVYKFDEIGCAVLWMDEEHIPWKDRAIIWVNDAKTGAWIDARKARYTKGAITPMAFGFAAYTPQTLPKGKETYDYETVAEEIRKIEAQNDKKVGSY